MSVFKLSQNLQKAKVIKSERHSTRHIFAFSLIRQFPCRVDPYLVLVFYDDRQKETAER